MEPQYIIYHDLIGFKTLARLKSKSQDANFREIGIVIDESRDMLITNHDNHVKKFIKKDYDFRFILPPSKKDGKNPILEVDGEKIIGLPLNRLRSLRKKRRI